MDAPRHPPTALMGLTTYLLSQTARTAKQDLDEALSRRGVRLRHMAVLAALADAADATPDGSAANRGPGGGAPSQLEIGRWLSIDPSDMTAVVDDLERPGYVVRTVDPADRRRRTLRLTAAGAQFFSELLEMATVVAHELLAPLPVDRRAALQADLAVLGAHVVQRRRRDRS